MIKSPQSYEEWLLTEDKADELGLKLLVTYQMLRGLKDEMIDAFFKVTKEAFKRALIDKGYKPQSIVFEREDDLSIRARGINAFSGIYQGVGWEDYSGYIFANARDFYHQVKVWENKSLWQYIKWWVIRKWNGRK